MLRRVAVFVALCLSCISIAPAASPDKQGAKTGVTAATTNPLGLPEKAVASGGSLIICGGGRTPVSVYDEFAKLAGGKGAKIIIIPSAYRYEPKMLEVLDARSREQADSTVFNKRLDEATGVWLGGGYQSRLSNLYAGTKAEATLRAIVERGGVVGGISAGAAAMSKVMIHSGRGENVVTDRGLGLLETAIVDQHFTQRNRLKRLLTAVEKNEGKVGIGIDEGTALVVAGNRLRVIGNHDATVVLPRANKEVLTLKLATSEQADLISAADAPTDVTRFDLRKLTGN
jgi:cyanophycinase